MTYLLDPLLDDLLGRVHPVIASVVHLDDSHAAIKD